jgi:tRNA threonylcarbamoyladenosine biosynthesis protein TsaB
MWLALETATDRASVAVGEGADDAVQESLTGARRHAGAVLPMIDSALRRSGVTLDRVSGILVSDGPGSFTGLRVGASVGKALAHARGLPLWTAPSLVARAAGVAGTGNRLILAVADALRGDVYAAAVRFQPGSISIELEPAVWRPEALARLGLAPDLLVGEAPPAAVEQLQRETGREMIRPPEGAPHAASLIALAAIKGGVRQ